MSFYEKNRESMGKLFCSMLDKSDRQVAIKVSGIDINTAYEMVLVQLRSGTSEVHRMIAPGIIQKALKNDLAAHKHINHVLSGAVELTRIGIY